MSAVILKADIRQHDWHVRFVPCLDGSELAILAILLASAMAATFVGRRVSNAVSQGRRLVPWILA